MYKQPCEPQVGADIEGFLYNTTSETYVPCVGILPGTKEKPEPFPNLMQGYAVQEDNVMAEFNIPPAKSGHMFSQYVKVAIQAVKDILPKDHTLKFESAVKFRPIDLTSSQAKTIGCDPDFDAYTGGEQRVGVPDLGLWRGAGGHIHLGGDFKCPDFVSALFAELFIGLTLDMGAGAKNDWRAKWYGRPGIFRPKPYGIEYRTPSSVWCKHGSTMSNVGAYAYSCARFLTTTDAVALQKIFRAIPWEQVRAYMDPNTPKNEKPLLRSNVLIQAQNLGVPI